MLAKLKRKQEDEQELAEMRRKRELEEVELEKVQLEKRVAHLNDYPNRRVKYEASMQELMARQAVITQPITTPIYNARGCDECHGTGYAGRVALMELCEVNNELRDLVEEGAPLSAMRAAAFKNGFRSLYQEGLQQVIGGHTSLDEIKCLSYTAM